MAPALHIAATRIQSVEWVLTKVSGLSCRIDRLSTGGGVVLRVSGRVRADDIKTIRESLAREVVAFDLTDVTIVDREVVTFLAGCEVGGVSCNNCPGFLREWIDKEKEG